MAASNAVPKPWPQWMKRREAHEYISVADNTFMKCYVKTGKVKGYPTQHGTRYNRDEIDEAVKHYYD